MLRPQRQPSKTNIASLSSRGEQISVAPSPVDLALLHKIRTRPTDGCAQSPRSTQHVYSTFILTAPTISECSTVPFEDSSRFSFSTT